METSDAAGTPGRRSPSSNSPRRTGCTSTGVRSAALRIRRRGSIAASLRNSRLTRGARRRRRRVVASAAEALGGVDPTTVAALGAVHLLPEDAEVAPRARTIATRRALPAAAARASTKASVPVPAAIAAIAAMVAAAAAADAHSRRRRDAVERVSLLHSEATGAYGADDASTVSASKKSDDGSPSRVVVAAAAAPRPPSASRPSSASRDTRRTLPLSAPRSGSLSTRLGVCAAQGCAGVRFSSLPIARLERTRTGAACSRTCRAARAPLAC